MTLSTTDNHRLTLKTEHLSLLEDLRWMAAPTLKTLCGGDHANLLVFPQSFEAYGDKIGDQRIFDIHGNELETGNIMGFVGRGTTMVKIQSRFAQDEGRDYFLHYMLQKVFSIHLFDLKHHSEEENIFDFLIYLFPTFLKKAVRQGIYKEYLTRHLNDANIRGHIDVSRHIRENIPFAGNVAYSTRVYAKNNHVTQLIRHTIEYIDSHPYYNGVLGNDEETKTAVQLIREATSSYNRNERERIINANIRPVHHPYFSEYKHLQHLCVQILRHEGMKYGHDENEIYGILFDGAWLWEEYLNTFLHPILEHPRNRTGEGCKYVFTNHTGECYPDFCNSEMILDAKYKGYANWNIQRADLYQVISYMYIMELKKGGFIVPTNGNLKPRTLNGYGGTITVFGLNVNHRPNTYQGFCTIMNEEEKRISELIGNMITVEDSLCSDQA